MRPSGEVSSWGAPLWVVEPFVCIQCGRLIEDEHCGEYLGPEAACNASKYALDNQMGGGRCFGCCYERAQARAKELVAQWKEDPSTCPFEDVRARLVGGYTEACDDHDESCRSCEEGLQCPRRCECRCHCPIHAKVEDDDDD